jgi:hypothetical protein
MVKNVDQGWVVFDYEVGMYMQMSALCMNGCRNHFSVPIQNALVESLLLHLRIVVDMLLSKGSDDDDLTLTDLLPEFTSQHIGELKSAYGTRSIKDSPCWTLNKMLAHATLGRANKYDYTRILQPLTPIIASLILEIEKARPKRANGSV